VVEPAAPGASMVSKDRNYFGSSVQHLLAELERIDLLIQLQVSRARQTQEFDEEFQGLYISEKEVDDLLARPMGLPRWATASGPLSQQEVQSVLNQLAAGVAGENWAVNNSAFRYAWKSCPACSSSPPSTLMSC
jgi:hypothetical protein